MTLLEQISAAKSIVSRIQHALAQAGQQVKQLESQRIDCPHVWGNMIPGYDHEGCNCTLCGMNDVYWSTFKNQQS